MIHRKVINQVYSNKSCLSGRIKFILDKIWEALDVYSQYLFNVGIKIRCVEDSYENLVRNLQPKVDAGIISKQDSIEF